MNVIRFKPGTLLITFFIIFIVYTISFPILYLLRVDSNSYFMYWLVGELIWVPSLLIVLKKS